jgi:hypothetical protein
MSSDGKAFNGPLADARGSEPARKPLADARGSERSRDRKGAISTILAVRLGAMGDVILA